MAKQIMTRARLAKMAPFDGVNPEWRHIMGPLFVWECAGRILLDYVTKGFAGTVAVLDADVPAEIDAAIDAWIDETNRTTARGLRRDGKGAEADAFQKKAADYSAARRVAKAA